MMRTLQLQIDDSIFDKFMGLLDILPKEKIFISNDSNAITLEEAKTKVQKAINSINENRGLNIDEAFNKVLDS